MERRTRVFLGKPALDGQLRGITVLSKALTDAGMEVIYLGVDLDPAEIGQAAVDEGVDVVGLSIHAGGPVTLVRKVRTALRERGADDVPILVGGIIAKSTALQVEIGKGVPAAITISSPSPRGKGLRGGGFSLGLQPGAPLEEPLSLTAMGQGGICFVISQRERKSLLSLLDKRGNESPPHPSALGLPLALDNVADPQVNSALG